MDILYLLKQYTIDRHLATIHDAVVNIFSVYFCAKVYLCKIDSDNEDF